MASPYAFISDELWDVAATHATPEDYRYEIAEECSAVHVSADDVRRAPVISLPAERRVPGGIDPLRQLAEATGPLRVRGALWPVVEDRLAVLVFLEGTGQRYDALLDSGTFDRCLTEATARHEEQSLEVALRDWTDLLNRIRQRKHTGEGVALFRCSVSGRVFGTYVHP